MTRDEEGFRWIIEELLDQALQEYYATEEHRLLREKREKMQADCVLMFTGEEETFARECFSIMDGIAGEELRFAYRRGMLDCAAMLKWMGILA